jgi:FkbM family methyltransferase
MIASIMRSAAGRLAKALPNESPEFIYRQILRGPLRNLFNTSMLALLPAEVSLPEGRVLLNPRDPIVSGLLMFGMYEPYESELFREIVKPGMTVIDIGANIGYFTIIAARRVGRAGRVIAFEPEPENRFFLEQSVEMNDLAHVMIYPIAIADKKGAVILNLFDSNKGKHSLVKDAGDDKGFSSRITVESTDLDSFLRDKGPCQTIDVIKMDIEGAESLALAGMKETLLRCRTLFMEYTPLAIKKAGHEPELILAALKEQGFSIYQINEKSRSLDEVQNWGTFTKEIPPHRAVNLLCTKEPVAPH